MKIYIVSPMPNYYNAWCFRMSNRYMFIGYIILVTLLIAVPYTYSVYTYNVSDDEGLDYVDSDLRGLDGVVDRVDIESVMVEFGGDSILWRIRYKGEPLTNEEIVNAASNGSFVYRVMVDVGITVNDEDGKMSLNIMSGMEYDEVKQEYVLATVTWYIYDRAGNVLANGFGLYEIMDRDIVFSSPISNEIVLSPPQENMEYLNLTSYINQQGKDLIIDALAYKVEVDVQPKDFSNNVDGGGEEQGDTVTTPEDSDTQKADDNVEPSDGTNNISFLYVGVAIALVIILAIFLMFRRRV